MVKRLRFVARNLKHSRRLEPIPTTVAGGVMYRGLTLAEIWQVYSLFHRLIGGRLSWLRLLVYFFTGSRLCIVAICTLNKKVLGCNMFYFNERDIIDGTIHGAFIGVDVTARGRCIDTELRRRAYTHFAKFDLTGVSTRISVRNYFSMLSARKVGFTPVESYVDETTGEPRCYLVCALGPYREGAAA